MLNALVTVAAEEGAEQNPLLPAIYDIIWSGVCFLIILVVIWRVVLPRVTKVLDERASKIEGKIEQAEAANREAEQALEQYTLQLADAKKEAGQIRDTAREEGKQIVVEARQTATVEADRVHASATQQIEAERQTAMVSLRSDVGTLALDLASRVIGESMADDAKAQSVVDRFLADLESSEQAKA